MPGDDICESVGHGPLSPVVSILFSDWSEGKYEILRGQFKQRTALIFFEIPGNVVFFKKSVAANPSPLARVLSAKNTYS